MENRHAAGQERPVWPPEPGYFRLALVKGAWAVPCEIGNAFGRWFAVIDGEVMTADTDPAFARMVQQVWAYGRKITVSEYQRLNGIRAWAHEHHPDHPCLHPRRSIDPMQLAPIVPKDIYDEHE